MFDVARNTPGAKRSRRPRGVPVALTAVAGMAAAVVLAVIPTASAATTTITPASITTTAGSTGGQPVSVLGVRDQSGTQDGWAKYVEFSGAYTGYLQYALPGVAASSVTGIQVQANYRGPATSTQTWTWSLYNWSTSAWVPLGTNAGAPSWGSWKLLTFAATGTLANYVSSSGALRVQLKANNANDAADIDYLPVIVTSGTTTADTVSPTMPGTPTVASKTSTSVSLTWGASTDNVGVTGYKVFVNGASAPAATASGTSATVSALSASTAYSFTVRARDAAGNRSAVSGAVTATTSAGTGTGTVTLPPFNQPFSYEISSPYGPSLPAAAWVSRAHEDTASSGKYNVCYVNAFQAQDTAGTGFPSAALLRTSGGSIVIDPDWDEAILDTRTAASRAAITSVIYPYLDECASKGFRAVELDNLDTFTRFSQLTQASNLALADALVAYGRSKGMAVAQKNTLELGSAGPQHFDFLVNEECAANSECLDIPPVWGSKWVDIEYGAGTFTTACSQVGATVSVNRRDVNVTPGAVNTTC